MALILPHGKFFRTVSYGTKISLKGFTLVEILVVLFIVGIAARWIVPTLPIGNVEPPEQQWMTFLKAAQLEARKNEAWIELSLEPQPRWIRWHWNVASSTWESAAWTPPAKPGAEITAPTQLYTPLPQRHIWIAPQRVIPFVQAVCFSERCVLLSPAGSVLMGAITDISHASP